MASPSNNRNRGARPTGGKAGGRAGKPSKPVAGTKDKTVRVPKEWNAKTVDPTNNRGSGQRPTGGQAGGRAGRPSGSIARPAAKPPTTAKPSTAVAKPSMPAAKPPAPAARSVGAAVRSLSGAGRFIGAAGTAAMLPSALGDVADGFQRLANHPFLTKNRSDNKGTSNSGGTGRNRRGGGRAGRGGTTSDVTPTRQGPPVPERLQNAPTPPILPAAVTRDSVRSSATSSAPSRSGSTPRRSGSTSPARKASSAPTPPSERRVSASTANRESGNYGTSKTNNPLMKDLVGRIKDREDRNQSSKASKLTSKFNTESNFSGEKVDGSKVDTKAKINSTTSEYDKKKRRYGG